jgi:glycosyltransferase involved in cell wall biosynthesis
VPSAHLIPALSGTRLAALHVCENFSRVASGKTAHLAHKQGLLILWNSNVMASKGVFDLFEAVRSLKRRGVTINLKVIGRVLADEELTKPKAEAFLAEAIADGTIDFLGAVSSEEATSLLSASDVVALPSRYTSELQPLALIEAMCAGCAIVAADTQALRATLGGYPAEIVAVRSIEDIVNSLDRLVANKAFDPKAFASNLSHSAVKAQKRFSVRRFDQTLANILEDTSDRIEQ